MIDLNRRFGIVCKSIFNSENRKWLLNRIKSKIYDSSREIGIRRCGDNFIQNNSEVKTINAKDVLDVIISNFKNNKI